MDDEVLLAWVDQLSDGTVEAAFVAAGTDRMPARRIFRDGDSARRWVETEARTFGARVKWRLIGENLGARVKWRLIGENPSG